MRKNKERYKEEFPGGSNLLWPSEIEDKVTRKFYKDISHLSKNIKLITMQKVSVIKQIFLIFSTVFK